MSELETSRSQPPPWLKPYTLYVIGVIVLALATYWAFVRLSGLLVTLLCSFFVAFAVEPGVNWLAKHGWKRGLATLAIYAGVALTSLIFVFLVGSLIADQIVGLVKSIPDGFAQVSKWLDTEFGVKLPTGSGAITSHLTDIGGALAGGILGVVTSVVGIIFQLFTIAMFAFYLAAEGPTFRRTVCSLLPQARQLEVLRVWELAISKTAGFLYSRIALAACSAIATTFFLWLVKVPYALTLGIFVGLISQFIPTIGTYIAGALPVIVALTISPQKALIVLAFILGYQQIENYLLAPPLSSRTMELHPAVAFGGVIAGASLLGAVGAFLALPAIATVQAFMGAYVKRHELVESELLKEAEREPFKPHKPWKRDDQPEITVDTTRTPDPHVAQ